MREKRVHKCAEMSVWRQHEQPHRLGSLGVGCQVCKANTEPAVPAATDLHWWSGGLIGLNHWWKTRVQKWRFWVLLLFLYGVWFGFFFPWVFCHVVLIRLISLFCLLGKCIVFPPLLVSKMVWSASIYVSLMCQCRSQFLLKLPWGSGLWLTSFMGPKLLLIIFL